MYLSGFNIWDRMYLSLFKYVNLKKYRKDKYLVLKLEQIVHIQLAQIKASNSSFQV